MTAKKVGPPKRDGRKVGYVLPASRAKYVIEQIKVSRLLTRLTQHALGELLPDNASPSQRPMDPSQVAAAKLLLDKALSNAPTRQEVSGPNGGEIPVSIGIRFVSPTE